MKSAKNHLEQKTMTRLAGSSAVHFAVPLDLHPEWISLGQKDVTARTIESCKRIIRTCSDRFHQKVDHDRSIDLDRQKRPISSLEGMHLKEVKGLTNRNVAMGLVSATTFSHR
jgi:hypothetical protein